MYQFTPSYLIIAVSGLGRSSRMRDSREAKGGDKEKEETEQTKKERKKTTIQLSPSE